MQRDDFGNLEEWGRVLNELAQLTRDRNLDNRQAGLVRLLRYPNNWRLREAALEAVRNVTQPTETLVSDVLEIMSNEHLYHEVRVLAAEALASLLAAMRVARDGRHPELERQALDQMHRLLESPHPPILHRAVQRVLPSVE